MQSLKKQPKKNLKSKNRLAILGIGSELRGDDAAGVLAAKTIQKNLENKKKKNIEIFIGETAPENLTGEIKKFKPTHLLIIDSAEMGKKPGEVHLFSPDEIKGVSFCTHQLPLRIMVNYLRNFIECNIAVIGIQPRGLAFDAKPSKEVNAAIKYLASAILEVF